MSNRENILNGWEDKPTVSVEDSAAILGISRNTAYSGVRRGEIPSIRIGKRLLVPTAELLKLLGRKTS